MVDWSDIDPISRLDGALCNEFQLAAFLSRIATEPIGTEGAARHQARLVGLGMSCRVLLIETQAVRYLLADG